MVAFSVIVSSRNRPAMLRRALASIRLQTHPDYEIVAVEDGSASEFLGDYDAIAAELAGHGRLYRLAGSDAGSGPSASRNHALRHCRGEFVAFLDDDDEWTDPEYLQRAAEALDAVPECDLHLANQRAVHPDGTIAAPPVWIEDIADKLPGADAVRDWCVVPLAALLRSDGFCHLNTTIIRRPFLQDRLGGFDETIRYEEDRDLYLRAIEAARAVVYSARFVAVHHVPDSKLRASASNQLSTDARIAVRLRVLDKAIAGTSLPAIRAYCRRLKGYLLRRLAAREAEQRNFQAAFAHARQALSTEFSYKWLGFLGWLWLNRMFRGRGGDA